MHSLILAVDEKLSLKNVVIRKLMKYAKMNNKVLVK
jgi:hypothetical protein